MDTFDGYLGALGFGGGQQQEGTSFAQADAARKTGDVQRQLAASKADLGLAGEEERQGINTDWEERGLFKSGMRGSALAQQQGREASKVAMLEAGAQADVGNIGADMQRQLASERAAQMESDADQQLQNLQLTYAQKQIDQMSDPNSIAAQQLALAREQLAQQKIEWERQLELQRKASGGNDYGGG